MVSITLTNQKTDSIYQNVIIHIDTGNCLFADNQSIALNRLIKDADFVHPLLNQTDTLRADHFYHYEYDDIDGLLRSAIYVYSILLRVQQPNQCIFKITPSAGFSRLPFEDNIHFSIHQRMAAHELISIQQLSALIGQLTNIPYAFSEDVLIDDSFTMLELPDMVNGDLLFEANEEWVKFLKTPSQYQPYELRYISPTIGLGLFARDTIKKGTRICCYNGIKKIRQHFDDKKLYYVFRSSKDALGMFVDAALTGNIARFVNHAPEEETVQVGQQVNVLLNANLKEKYIYLNGIGFVFFIANRDIMKGEQLLVNYGAEYFSDRLPEFRFKKNGQMLEKKKFKRQISLRRINHLHIIARHGVNTAKAYLIFRLLFISTMIILLCGLLKY